MRWMIRGLKLALAIALIVMLTMLTTATSELAEERDIERAGEEKPWDHYPRITGISILDVYCRGDTCQGMLEIIEEGGPPGPDP